MQKDVLLASMLICMATSSAAWAGNNVEKSKADSLHTYQLQTVVVASTRAGNKTPMAFQNVSRKELQSVNFGKDIPYLLSLTPSVITTSDAGNGIGYTTLRVRGTDPTRINITVNGVPQNDAESSGLYWASNVQSMQIQRGVGTSTNGAGAFGATVNMLTENIGTTPYMGLDLSGGSYYSHKETFRFSTGLLGGHWGVQGRLSNIGSKGYIRRASTKLNSYFLQGGYFSDNTMVKLLTYNGNEETYHASTPVVSIRTTRDTPYIIRTRRTITISRTISSSSLSVSATSSTSMPPSTIPKDRDTMSSIAIRTS